MSRSFPFALLAAGLASFGAHAGSIPTPGPGIYIIGGGGTGPLDSPGFSTSAGTVVVPGSYGLNCSTFPCTPISGGLITVSGNPAPLAFVHLTGGELSSNSAFTYVTYQYSVVGVSPGDTTPGHMLLNMQTGYNDPQDLLSASAEVQLDNNAPYEACRGVTACPFIVGSPTYPQNIIASEAVTLQATGEIQLLANVAVSFLPNAEGVAYADPVISADNGDQIVLSPLIVNATAPMPKLTPVPAPEPASLLLLSAGLGGVARLRRRSTDTV